MLINTIDINEDNLRTFYTKINNNIIRIRKAKKISQLDLATSIGHSSATFIGKAELLADNKHFNLEHLYKIALALNINMKDFFEGIGTIGD